MSETEALTALQQGRYGDAARLYESLADEGAMDASLSFNRGLAYAGKLSLAQRDPGDFGQAVAAFREAARLSTKAQTRTQAREMLQALEAAPHETALASLETAAWPPDVETLPSLGAAPMALGVILVALALRKRLRGGSLVPLSVAGALFCATLGLFAWQTYERARGAHAVVVRTFSAGGLTILEGTSVRIRARSGPKAIIDTAEGTFEASPGVLRVLQSAE